MARTLSVSRAQLWQERLARFHAVPQSVAEFCRLEGVSQPSFYQWQKRLLPRHSATRGSSGKTPTGFRTVHVVPPFPSPTVSVQLPGGTQLAVPTADHDSLRIVIETIARLDAAREGAVHRC